MKSAWAVLLISAATDAILAGYAALMAAISIDSTSMNRITWIAIVAGMLAAGARTIQQALKVTPVETAQLKGKDVEVSQRQTPDGVVTTITDVKPSNGDKK